MEELALPTDQLTIQCGTIAATEKVGQIIGQRLFPGAVIALVGPLGAGKTLIARAIAQGLDIEDSSLVTSPTFVLVQEYLARFPIYHFDVYRLKRGSDFLDLGVEEYLNAQGVCLIEWADRVEKLLPRARLWVELEVVGAESRAIKLVGSGAGYAELLGVLKGKLRNLGLLNEE